jgi:hypothetical protein
MTFFDNAHTHKSESGCGGNHKHFIQMAHRCRRRRRRRFSEGVSLYGMGWTTPTGGNEFLRLCARRLILFIAFFLRATDRSRAEPTPLHLNI